MFAHNGYWLHPANCQLFSVHVRFLLPARCRTRLSTDSCSLHDAGRDCQLILAPCTMQDAIVS
ncbi:hypothetical protein CLI80_07145 [Porphyromonas gingivalis]|nr:hypothetical protein CLI80_07145 [Porphyromonas gingivalis]